VNCPYCSGSDTRVVDSRLAEPGDAVRRRRECAGCGQRFTTYERVEGIALTVRKRDGRGEPFDRDKLLGGLLRAATKRPVTVPELEALADSIAAGVRARGGEAGSDQLGELALRGLIGLDRVAAIRFASVYRNFEDLAQFEAELRRLEREPATGADQLALEGAGGGSQADPGAPVLSELDGSIDPSAAGPPRGQRIGRTPRRRAHVEPA
jgi:transcriptional repressor NrdR